MAGDAKHFAVVEVVVASEDVVFVATRNNVVDFHCNVSVVTFRTFVEWFAGFFVGATSCLPSRF
jgi:hypothetical protein